MSSELSRLAEVVRKLRKECPWDAEQTHLTLVNFLIEETSELVEAIEGGDDTHLCEELGDLLVQVYLHAEIARSQGRFDIEDVARGIADKLIRRHPHVYAGAAAPDDKWASWEAAKRAEKGRRSALDGIPDRLSSLSRAHKVVSRARAAGIDLDLENQPVSAAEVGEQILALVSRAQASGIDPDQAARSALRVLEARIEQAETSGEEQALAGTQVRSPAPPQGSDR